MLRTRLVIALIIGAAACLAGSTSAQAATLAPLSVDCGSGGSHYPATRSATVGDTVSVTNTSGSATCNSVDIWVAASPGNATWTSSAAPGVDPSTLGPGDVFTITFTRAGNVVFRFNNTTLPSYTTPVWSVSAAPAPAPVTSEPAAPDQLLGLERRGSACPPNWSASWATWARAGLGGGVCMRTVPAATVVTWSSAERERVIADASAWLGTHLN